MVRAFGFWRVSICAVGVAAACLFPTDGCGCSPAPPVALVYGRVVDGAGAGAPFARLFAELAVPDCGGPKGILGIAIANANGEYRLNMSTQNPGISEGCLLVRADPRAGSPWLPSNPTQVIVSFTTAPRPDSVRVDLALRAP